MEFVLIHFNFVNHFFLPSVCTAIYEYAYIVHVSFNYHIVCSGLYDIQYALHWFVQYIWAFIFFRIFDILSQRIFCLWPFYICTSRYQHSHYEVARFVKIVICRFRQILRRPALQFSSAVIWQKTAYIAHKNHKHFIVSLFFESYQSWTYRQKFIFSLFLFCFVFSNVGLSHISSEKCSNSMRI